MKYEIYFKDYLGMIEQTLEKLLPPERQIPAVIHEAMRYGVFPGGKRFRPVIVLSACVACGGKPEDALIPAASLEFIHSSSLIHDDLPSLDNDSIRRGKPSCHIQYGEAMALLAGDGLLTLGFQVLAKVQPSRKARLLLDEISTSSGTYGMIGGQVADISTPPQDLNLPMLDFISTHKTGKLIRASAVSGAIAAGASREVLQSVARYGEFLGLAFQCVDDLMDHDGYARFMKDREIRQKVRDLIANAKREIRLLGKKSERLLALADYLLRSVPKANHVEVDR